MSEEKIYDLVIIGAGPAGLSSSIYASRYKLDHLVIGSEVGGQVTEAWEIENYAGFEKISGKDLMDKFIKQTKILGGEIKIGNVSSIIKKDDIFLVETDLQEKFLTKSLILSVGMKPRKMNIPGEKDFIGRGVSYCATCDAMFFRDKKVAVIGGGNSAAMAAVHLADFSKEISLIYRNEYKFEPIWEEKIKNNSKIKLIKCEEILEIKGKEKVEKIIFKNEDKQEEVVLEGVFIEIGTIPGITLAEKLGVKIDEQSYIIVDQSQATNVAGVWAAGDVTTESNKFRQIITAVAEGAVASGSVYKYLKLRAK